MSRKLTLGATIIVAAAAFTPVHAAPLAPQSPLAGTLAADGNLLTEVRKNGGGGRRSGGGGRHRWSGGGGGKHSGGGGKGWGGGGKDWGGDGHHSHRRHRHRPHIFLYSAPYNFYDDPYYYYQYDDDSCSYWRRRCAGRHGWRTRSYYRCLRRREC